MPNSGDDGTDWHEAMGVLEEGRVLGLEFDPAPLATSCLAIGGAEVSEIEVNQLARGLLAALGALTTRPALTELECEVMMRLLYAYSESCQRNKSGLLDVARSALTKLQRAYAALSTTDKARGRTP